VTIRARGRKAAGCHNLQTCLRDAQVGMSELFDDTARLPRYAAFDAARQAPPLPEPPAEAEGDPD
jgi:hypothetical protein